MRALSAQIYSVHYIARSDQTLIFARARLLLSLPFASLRLSFPCLIFPFLLHSFTRILFHIPASPFCRLDSLNEEPLRPVRIAVAGAVATIAKVEVRSQHEGRYIRNTKTHDYHSI
jgi:hypothetical protein